MSTPRRLPGVAGSGYLPRVLVIDDLFGRVVRGGLNEERNHLCGHLLMKDVTGGPSASVSAVFSPVAEAEFFRGQFPTNASLGDFVLNDLEGSLARARSGWSDSLARGDLPWAMVLLDLCFYTGHVTDESSRIAEGMPEGRAGDDDPRQYFGLILLDAIHRSFPELPVIILSSKPRDEVSLEFTRRGVLGFIARDDLHGPELLKEGLWNHGLMPDPEGMVIGHSLPMLLALREARRAAGLGQNVLIRGERGTGKELLAGYLHRVASRGVKRPFVAVNSAAFTSSLFAAELFGIEPRTATNVEGKIGLIESADGGDLFLDEIADMPPEVQAAVLRVLQERQLTCVGGRKPKWVDVRFLSATNADLDNPSLGFRPDLLDRLRLGGSLSLPPLRDRRADIPLLAESFLRSAEAQRPGAIHHEITVEAMEVLLQHDWPGNVRELRVAIFDAFGRHRDVEYLVPGHLRLKRVTGGVNPAPKPDDANVAFADTAIHVSSLDELSHFQASMRFDYRDVRSWAGRLEALRRDHARLLARYLLAAIEVTKQRTPDCPEGVVRIHPAVKIITGDSRMTASKAADVVKQLLAPLEAELEGHLREAYATAVRLRPRAGRAKSTQSGPSESTS